MIFKKRTVAVFAVVICLAVISAAISQGFKYITASTDLHERPTVILDAGHPELS